MRRQIINLEKKSYDIDQSLKDGEKVELILQIQLDWRLGEQEKLVLITW